MNYKLSSFLEKLAKGKPSAPKDPVPSKKDKQTLTVKELQSKYPKTYKTESDAALARIDATDNTALYKQWLSKNA